VRGSRSSARIEEVRAFSMIVVGAFEVEEMRWRRRGLRRRRIVSDRSCAIAGGGSSEEVGGTAGEGISSKRERRGR
jgi:hypothetical protein